jgi:hypothetical protein
VTEGEIRDTFSLDAARICQNAVSSTPAKDLKASIVGTHGFNEFRTLRA